MNIPYWKRKKLETYLENASVRKQKKLNDLDKYLIFAFTSLILFTIAVLIIFAFTGTEPAVLIGCFFGAFITGFKFFCADTPTSDDGVCL